LTNEPQFLAWPTFRTLFVSPLSVLLFFSLIIASLSSNPFLIIAILLLIPLAWIVANNPVNLLLATVAYISVLESSGWGSKYDFLTIYVSYPVVIAFLVFTYFRSRIAVRSEKLPASVISRMLSGYIFFSLVSFAVGVLNGHSLKFAVKELMFIGFYSGAAIATLSLKRRQDLFTFLKGFVIIAFLTAVGFVILALKSVTVAEIFLQRIVTQQPHIAIFAIPLLVSFWLLKPGWLQRVSILVFFPTILMMVIISQQRALWVAIVGVIFLTLFFNFLKEGIDLAGILRAIFTMLGIIVGLGVVIIILDQIMLGSTLVTMATRIESIQNAQYDTSLAMRFEEIGRALQGWDTRLLFGTGLGSAINRVAAFETFDVVDNGYAYIFWKQGLIGLVLFLMPYCISIYFGLGVILKGRGIENKMVVSSVLAGIIGLMVVGLTNTSFILYRFTILWGIFLVIIEKFYRFEFDA